MLESNVSGCPDDRHLAIEWLRLNLCRGRSVLTCVTDILSIDRIRAVTGGSVKFCVAGDNRQHKLGSAQSGAMDID